MVHNYNIIMKTAFDLVKILLNNLFRFDLSSTCKLVLLSLADCYNPKHEYVFPKQSTIAKKLGITEKSVSRAINTLEKFCIISKTRKYSNLYTINIKQILDSVKIDLFKVTNFPLEDFDKKIFSKDSDSVKKTQELIGSFKAMELKEDYTSWSREQAVRHLVRVIPAPVLKKSPLAKYLMEKYSITIDEVMKLKKEHKPGED